MELTHKLRKFIASTHKLPEEFDTGQFITSLPSALGSAYNSFGYKSGDEMKAEALSGSGSVGGFGYETKTLNSKAIADERSSRNVSNVINTATSFAAAGSAAGPIGTAVGMGVGALVGGIGSIVGGNKEEQEQNLAQMSLNLENNAGRDFASTKSLRHLNAIKYGAKDGKLPKCNEGNLPPYAFTEHGLVFGLKPNAMGAPGETMSDGNGNDFVLPGTPSNNDTLPIYASGKTTIVTNKKGLSKYYQQTGDLAGVQAAMSYYKQHGYKNGKMPGCAEGWLGNAVPAILGGVAGLGQVISSIGNEPYRPNTYSANPYEGVGLNTLAGLRINPYPIMQLLRNAEARTNRAIDIAGGLSGGLRTAARLAALNATQNNISKVLSDIQQQNNAYRSSYAQAALNAGQQNRQARMSANQWDLDYYSKAHAARNRGIQTGIANMLAQIQQYQANEFKRRQFNETMDLYRADQKQRNEQNQWIRNWYASQGNTTNTYSPLLPVNTKATPIQDPYAQYDPNIARQLAMLNYLGYKK